MCLRSREGESLAEPKPARKTRLGGGLDQYQAKVIDTWKMTVTPVEGTFHGQAKVLLQGKPYLALRLLRR